METNLLNDTTWNELVDVMELSTVEKSINLYFNELDTLLNALNELELSHDVQNIERQVHSAKGSSLTFGAEKLGHSLQKLELLFKEILAGQSPDLLGANILIQITKISPLIIQTRDAISKKLNKI